MTGVPLHLFLTGEIQVGKSTIVSSVLSRLGVPVSWVCAAVLMVVIQVSVEGGRGRMVLSA